MTEKMKDGIIKRGAGYSYVVRTVDPKTGERKQQWVSGFATRSAAKAARDAARHSVNQGTYVAPQTLTVGAWLERWIEGHAVELKPSTVAGYRAQVERYLVPAIGRERLQQLSPSRLSVLWRTMHESGGVNGKPLSARTVAQTRAILRKAMQDAVVERLVPINPVIGSKMPKRGAKPKHTTWTGAQVRAFIEVVVAREERWAPMWQLFLATGMRRGEVAGLRWSAVDFESGVVSVEVSTTQIGRERVTTAPKNHERRDVEIDPQTLAVLRAWKVRQTAERLAWGAAYVESDGVVFTWEDGRPVMPDYITKTFDRLQREIGGDRPRLVVHGMRHTHATILLRDGVPVHVVSKRLGHRDPSVTLDVYADAIPEDDSRAVDTFRKAVWGA